MIVGHFHQGSGLGNQLARYVFTRVKALDLGVDFGMIGTENFKGKNFMNLDMGKPPESCRSKFIEERVNHLSGADIRPYDAKSALIEDSTEVDGEFQDERYWKHREDEVQEWLQVEPLRMKPYVCVINFRGGEYVGVDDLFLPIAYWDKAIRIMRRINDGMIFEVHTDDAETACKFFPDFKIVQDIEINWRAIRHAKYLILSNSSFAILPALLNDHAKCILAPKFWAGYNVGYWKLPQNHYKKFTYIHHVAN